MQTIIPVLVGCHVYDSILSKSSLNQSQPRAISSPISNNKWFFLDFFSSSANWCFNHTIQLESSTSFGDGEMCVK